MTAAVGSSVLEWLGDMPERASHGGREGNAYCHLAPWGRKAQELVAGLVLHTQGAADKTKQGDCTRHTNLRRAGTDTYRRRQRRRQASQTQLGHQDYEVAKPEWLTMKDQAAPHVPPNRRGHVVLGTDAGPEPAASAEAQSCRRSSRGVGKELPG